MLYQQEKANPYMYLHTEQSKLHVQKFSNTAHLGVN